MSGLRAENYALVKGEKWGACADLERTEWITTSEPRVIEILNLRCIFQRMRWRGISDPYILRSVLTLLYGSFTPFYAIPVARGRPFATWV